MRFEIELYYANEYGWDEYPRIVEVISSYPTEISDIAFLEARHTGAVHYCFGPAIEQ